MAFSHLFYGDYRRGEDPLAFLTDLETTLARRPHLSESEKCECFYLHCKSDSDAEDWYEDLERNSPTVVASWSTFVKHFRVKWLGAPPSSLLEPDPVISKKTDTATPIVFATVANANMVTTTTTTIPAHINTAVPATFDTTATPERLDQEVDARHVTPVPTRSGVKPTTTTTVTAPNNAIVTTEQQDNKDPAVGREEEEKGVEKQDRTNEQEPVREVDTGEQEGAGMTQDEVGDPTPSPTARLAFDAMLHEPVRFDWAAEVDEALDLSLVAPSNSTAPTPVNPIPSDVMVDPVCIAFANPMPSNLPTTPSVHPDSISIHPACACALPVDPEPADFVTNPTGVALAKTNTTPIKPNHTSHELTTIPITGDTAANANIARSPTSPTKPGAIECRKGSNEPPARSISPEAVPTPTKPDPPPPKPITAPFSSDVAPRARTPAKCVPSDGIPAASVPINTIPVDPDPVNPNSVTTNDCTHVTITYLMPADSVPADPNQVVHVDTICITPTKPVHIDPVSVTLVAYLFRQALTSVSHPHLLCKFRPCIKDTYTCFLKFHFILFSSFGAGES